MYAPVVSRFETYAISVEAPARAYIATMTALPAWKEWAAAGRAEKWTIPHDEVD
jgi:glutathione S-transferase